ncbi:MAG: trypsin-like serine protease [bacterium]
MDFEVAAIYVPEPFNSKTLKNDIAVVKLADKVTFNDDIQPICLPPSNVVYNGQSAFVTGA